MSFENVAYSPQGALPDLGDDHAFRYCTFENLDENHALHVDAIFLSCEFRNNDFYWALFNGTLFSECEFANCTFHGVAFIDCRFVGCTFDSCTFTTSNLGGPCRFEGSKWYGCSQSRCVGWEDVW
jgi:uncharacterized protein YjbI with pentapeptide repeats